MPLPLALCATLLCPLLTPAEVLPSLDPCEPVGPRFRLERLTTAVPFPRGLQLVEGKLYVLARGRARQAGGVSAEVDDKAGTIFEVDPQVFEPVDAAEVSEAVRSNARVVAAPTAPPFRLWDTTAQPPSADRGTDRPYCNLRFHEGTQSFYVCAFAGVDKPYKKGEASFSKNLSDALLRFDLRTGRWYEVERHDIEAGGSYPQHDPAHYPPPHGWLNGPDNCLVVGNWLYAVAKDNSVLVRYDLSALCGDPEAGAPQSEFVLGSNVVIEQTDGRGVSTRDHVIEGHSALAHHDGWLYLGTRTSSEIVRFRLDAQGNPVRPLVCQLVARFAPFDPETHTSANLTDMDFDAEGNLYVISARPARVYRFRPDPAWVFDARDPSVEAYVDLAALTGNPKMKSENVLVDREGIIYVTSGDAYDFQYGANGTVYRVTPLDS